MKTPFSFLGRLLARGRTVESQALLSPPADNSEKTKVLDLVAEPATKAEPADAVIVPTPDEVMPTDVPAPETMANAEESAAAVSVDDTLPLPAEETLPLATKPRVTRAPRAKAKVPSTSPDIATNDPAEPSQAPVIQVMSDEARLDGEIAELKRQLAEKLRLQNTQLKKRLERFNRS